MSDAPPPSASPAPRRALTKPAKTSSVRKKVVAGLTAFGLAATGLVFSSWDAAAAEPITGTVFRDYGGDGAYDTTGDVRDSLLGGVTVTAYLPSGEEAGSATTEWTQMGGANYSLPIGAVASGTPLRIEFTNIPEGSHDTFSAGASSVQFTTAGSTTPVSYGVFDANQYAQPANPAVMTAIQSAGARNFNTATANQPAIVATLWNATGTTPTGRTTFAAYGRVGSIGSLAGYSVGNSVFAAATYKRFSDFGPLGLGGIYMVSDVTNPATGAPTANGGTNNANNVSDWLDVTSLGINVGSVNRATPLGNPSNAIPEVDAFEKAAKVGIGGLAVDNDSKILYFVNLADKRIYAIDIETKTLAGSWDSPAVGNGNQRAFALTIHDGDLYVGYNDTGEATPFNAAGSSMKYFVAKKPLSNLDGAWTTVLNNGDLGYTKGNPINGWAGTAPSQPQVTRWNTWTDVWRQGTSTVGLAGSGQWTAPQVYPQPILSSISFDRDGYMILGLQDRTALQSGNRNMAAITGGSTTALFETVSGGDLLIAAPNADRSSYTPESNGVVGSRTANVPATPATRSTVSPTAQGPGGREFFDDSQSILNNVPAIHLETSLGSTAVVPGGD